MREICAPTSQRLWAVATLSCVALTAQRMPSIEGTTDYVNLIRVSGSTHRGLSYIVPRSGFQLAIPVFERSTIVYEYTTECAAAATSRNVSRTMGFGIADAERHNACDFGIA
jgi:hypothetical protein